MRKRGFPPGAWKICVAKSGHVMAATTVPEGFFAVTSVTFASQQDAERLLPEMCGAWSNWKPGLATSDLTGLWYLPQWRHSARQMTALDRQVEEIAAACAERDREREAIQGGTPCS